MPPWPDVTNVNFVQNALKTPKLSISRNKTPKFSGKRHSQGPYLCGKGTI